MLRYYPDSKVLKNRNSSGGEFLDGSGKEYRGKYYTTYDGKNFSGPSPEIGPSKPLQKIKDYDSSPIISSLNLTDAQKENLAAKTNVSTNRILGKPNSHYPQPTSEDYTRGYVIRYFAKKINDTIIIEISEEEYNNISNGTTDYNIRLYQTTKILWKITGPLKSQRKSQYNIIPGIIDTNQRLTESANKTFLGIIDYIGGDYSKFSKPTE
jgi:hypothetical protein